MNNKKREQTQTAAPTSIFTVARHIEPHVGFYYALFYTLLKDVINTLESPFGVMVGAIISGVFMQIGYEFICSVLSPEDYKDVVRRVLSIILGMAFLLFLYNTFLVTKHSQV